MALSLQQPVGHLSPSQPSAVLSLPSKTPGAGVVPTQKLLPVLRNRYVGQEGMKLGVAGSSQQQLEFSFPLM